MLYALLPLVRGVVAGLSRRAGCTGERPRDGDEPATVLLADPAAARLAPAAAQPAGGGSPDRRDGGYRRADWRRRFWRAGVPGLLSSALDLVLLGVVPTIALAVVIDALFALWLALLGRRAND